MMAIVSAHSSNPFRPSSSAGARAHKYYPKHDILAKAESSNDPICGYDEQVVKNRRLTRRAVRLNHPDKDDDELLLYHSTTQGIESHDATGQPTMDEDEYGEEQTLQYEESEHIQATEWPQDAEMEESPDGYYDSDDEENSLFTKPVEEQEEIESEIKELYQVMPDLREDYHIFDRLGTGTFSSVYKAIDLHYHEMDNNPWHGHHPPTSSAYYQSIRHPPTSKVYVAIKRIYVTSNPERIRNEISILEDLRGCRHVSQLITAFREQDQVVAVMPYHRNEDFREFYLDLPWSGIRSYFRCLFRSLKDVHARGIIHRDVKPANFLFDPQTGNGTLCDFGLACRVDYSEWNNPNRTCLHGIPNRENLHGSTADEEQLRNATRDPRKRLVSSDRIGYLADDRRPTIRVNRAGTRGFRAPEVLLKCPEQTAAIDIWSAGVVLLFYLCGRFPMFKSNDDIEALMEIAVIIGRKRMERTAALHGKSFLTNIPSLTPGGTSWREFCKKINPQLYTSGPPAQEEDCSDDDSDTSSLKIETEDRRAQVDGAIDLLEHLLDPDSTRRYAARDALNHPWLREENALDYDDEFFPHPIKEGVCGDLHYVDEANIHVVKGIDGNTHRQLVAGEGIAIGFSPCELHAPKGNNEDQ